MWEFITESGMLKNIYFKHLLYSRKRYLALNKRFKSFETSIRSNRDPCRELYLQHGVDSLDVTIHHRFWDAQKHLLQTLITLSEKIFGIEQKVQIIWDIYSTELRPLQRVIFETWCRFTRCDNSSHNLGCTKTSTSNSY